MKKLLVIALSLICISGWATDYSAYGKMTLKGASSKTSKSLTFFASSEFVNGPAYDDGGDSPEIMTGQNMYFYAIGSDNNYASYADTVFRNVPIAFQGPAEDTQFEISFSNWYSKDSKVFKLYDAVENKYVNVVNSTNYNFSITTGGVSITDRFILEYVAPEFEICHRYGKLQITGYEGEVIVRNAAGTAVITETVAAPYKEIDLDGQPNGQYTVELPAKSKTLTISVQNVKLMK